MHAETSSGRALGTAAIAGRALATFAVAGYLALGPGLGVAAAAEPPVSHYGPGHWYPTECCSRMDCRPIPEAAVRLTATGWLVIETEEIIPFGHRKERRSRDGQFHRCSFAFRPNATARTSDRTICLFVPGQMM